MQLPVKSNHVMNSRLKTGIDEQSKPEVGLSPHGWTFKDKDVNPGERIVDRGRLCLFVWLRLCLLVCLSVVMCLCVCKCIGVCCMLLTERGTLYDRTITQRHRHEDTYRDKHTQTQIDRKTFYSMLIAHSIRQRHQTMAPTSCTVYVSSYSTPILYRSV